MISHRIVETAENVSRSRHMNLRTAAKFTGKFVKGRLEIVFAKENAGQA